VVLHRYNLYLGKEDVTGYCKAGKTLLAFLFRDYYYRHEIKGQPSTPIKRITNLIIIILYAQR